MRHVRLPKLWAGPIFARDRDAVLADSLDFAAEDLDEAVAAFLGLDAFPAARVAIPAGATVVHLGASPNPLRRPTPAADP